MRSFSNDFTLFSNPLISLVFFATFIFEISYLCSKLAYFSCTFFSYETCSFMSFIDFISSSVLKLAVLSCVVPVVVVPVATSIVVVGRFGARVVPRVEGTAVETTGITLGSWEVDSPRLSFNAFLVLVQSHSIVH